MNLDANDVQWLLQLIRQQQHRPLGTRAVLVTRKLTALLVALEDRAK